MNPGEDTMVAHAQEQQPGQRVSEAAKLAKRLAIKWMPKTPTVLRINCQAAILEHHYASQPASATPQRPKSVKPEELSRLTPEEKRIRIAELCGWIFKTFGNGATGWVDRVGFIAYSATDLPDYLNDLNAMHDAEKILSHVQMTNYRLTLLDICGGGASEAVCATAAKRADAFLLTLCHVPATTTPRQ